jgi:hypothetical protein
MSAMILFLVVGFAAPTAGQRTTGEIIGKISDSSGGVLPGVTVTLRGPALQGELVVVSSEAGLYRFPVVPPGMYELEYSLVGFNTLRRTEIPVVVGANLTLDVTMNLGAVAESITVSGAAPVVNLRTAQVATNFTSEVVRNLPVKRHSFFDIINSAPGVQQNSSLGTSTAATVFGSTNNAYLIDGTQIGSNSWLGTDAIDETQVLTLGASAQYGNVQGAVFNIVTRQGGNQLRGDANWYFLNQKLVSSNTKGLLNPNGTAVDGGRPYQLVQYRDVSGQVGGPVLTDKFWFFGSVAYNTNWDAQPNTDPAFPIKSDEKRIFWKLTYSINSNHRLMVGYADDYYLLPQNVTPFVAPSTVIKNHGHNPTPNWVYTGVLSDRTLVEARLSGVYNKTSNDPLFGGASRLTRYTDSDASYVTGGVTSTAGSRTWTKGGQVKISHTADRFLGGNHAVDVGLQYMSNGNEAFTFTNDAVRFFSSTLRQATVTTKLPQLTGTSMVTWGTYIDDTLRLGDRVTMNLGVRYDQSRGFIPSFPLLDAQGIATGQVADAINVETFKTVSPRFGLNFQLFKQTVVKGHYGQYYSQVPRDFGSLSRSTTPTLTFNCAGQPTLPADPLVAPSGFCADASSRTFVSQTAPANNVVDPNRKNDYTHQYILQVEQGITQDLGLLVNVVHKRGGNLVATQEINGTYAPVTYVDNVGVDATGQTLTFYRLTSNASDRLFSIGNPTDRGLYTRYNGVLFALTKRMSNNWQGVISVNLSKSEGLLGGNGDSGPNEDIFADGLRTSDRPVVAKATFLYNFPWGIMAAVNSQYQSGEPYARTVQRSDLGFPSAVTIQVEPRDGSRRFPALKQVDLRLQKAFTLSGTRTFNLFLDALNLNNDHKTENVASTVGTSSAFGVPTRYIMPRRIQLGMKFVW